MILGTPTTECILNVITESEITKLSVAWAVVRTSTIQQAYCARVNHIWTDVATQPLDIRSFNEAVKLKDKVTIQPFETSIVKAKTDTIMTGGRLHIFIHSLDARNNKLPNGLEVSVMYTDLKRGSKSIPVVLRSMTGSGITLNKGDKVTWVQTANKMPKTNLHPSTLEALDEEQGSSRRLLTRVEGQAKVLKELNLEALNECPEELAQHV